MKFDKLVFVNKLLKVITLALMIAGIAACSSNPNRSANIQSSSKYIAAQAKVEEKSIALIDSSSYLPRKTRDEKTGEYLPYQRTTDPYELQRGQIDATAVVQFIKARRLYQRQEFEKAEIELKAITEKHITLSGPWVMRGDIAHKNNNIKFSEECYRKAILNNADNVNAYLRLAKVLRMQGKYIQAQNMYVEVLKRWRDFPEAHLNLAVLYDIYLNRLEDAQRHLEAYQFLTQGKDARGTEWLSDLQQRTGLPVTLTIEVNKADSITTETNPG